MDVWPESFGEFLKRTRSVWACPLFVYMLLAGWLPPLDDEVYYWSWSKSLQLSYFDHPGMVAWMIWLSTRLFGDTVFGMRFPACCCMTFTLAVIGFLLGPSSPQTDKSSSDSQQNLHLHPLLWGIALTPLFTFGGFVITPDAPLLAAWSAYLLWMVAIQTRLTAETPSTHLWRWWVLGGVILGLGGLSKYTMILAVPSGLVSFAVAGLSWRKWMLGYLFHGVISMIVASPILLYNLQHHFEPLLFQWRHAMHDEPATLVSFLEFWTVQLLLFGTLPFYLIPRTLLSLATLRQNVRLRICSCLYLIPFCFFIYKAAKTELEGNWALVMYVGVWPVAAAWYDTVRFSRLWRRLTAAGFLPPAICVVGLFVLIFSPIPILPAKWDRLHRQQGRWQMVQAVAKVIHDRHESIPTFATTYQMTALLRFWGVDARQEAEYRASHFSFPPEHLADVPTAYVLADHPLPSKMTEGFTSRQFIDKYVVLVHGEPIDEFELWRYDTQK